MLIGKKVILRSIEDSDIDKFYKWRNDLNIKKLAMMHPFPVNYESEKEWFETMSRNKDNHLIVFSVCEKKENRLIGYVKLFNINWIHRYCYFGIVLGEESSRGKGYGKETLQLITQYAFEILNLRKITLEVININNAAINLYKKFGFVEEGVLKEQFFFDNEWHDVIIMSLFKEKK